MIVNTVGHANRVVLQQAEYDIYLCDPLQKELQALTRGRNIVDFRNVRYIDSSGISCLVVALKAVLSDDPDATIAFEHVTPSVRRVFMLVGLDNIFEIEDLASH